MNVSLVVTSTISLAVIPPIQFQQVRLKWHSSVYAGCLHLARPQISTDLIRIWSWLVLDDWNNALNWNWNWNWNRTMLWTSDSIETECREGRVFSSLQDGLSRGKTRCRGSFSMSLLTYSFFICHRICFRDLTECMCLVWMHSCMSEPVHGLMPHMLDNLHMHEPDSSPLF